jgi:hypothetical protein
MSDCSCSLFEQPPCTACEPRIPVSPLSLVNRPGLSRLTYRVGTFSVFRQAMLDAFVLQPVRSADPANPNRSNTLATWSSDDYGVAVLELWAYVLDVLTFYQQSVVNESFIRTAQLRESLARLAALLGYEPARGVAATVLLAFFADEGSSPKLPAGLRVQSVPPPGKNPATFELSNALTIISSANQPVLLGTLGDPGSAVFEASGELAPHGDDNGPPVTSGTKLVFYNTSAPYLGEQVVSAVTPTPLGGKLIAFRGNFDPLPLPVNAMTVARYGRKFRIFGASAPANYLQGVPNSQDNSKIAWTAVQMSTDGSSLVPAQSFAAPSQSVLFLEGSYDGIAAGAQLVVFYTGTATDATLVLTCKVVLASSGSSQRGPVSGTSTVLAVDQTLPQFNDVRLLTVYEVLGNPLIFLQQTNSDDIPAGSGTLYVVDASGVQKGAAMIQVSGPKSDVITATGAPVSDSMPQWAIPIGPPLANDYTASQTLLFANVVSATHGETQIEQVLGDGDASQEWQEFVVPVSPVTYVPDPGAARGAGSTLQVFVNETEWTEVSTFYGHGPDESIFTTRVDENGVMYVRFGNGQTGRRLPTGVQNVTAQMRKGLGTDGNVLADAISIILQAQPGLKSVINPLAAIGGADPESADSIQQTAPSSVITLGRAISLRDYEVLALSYFGVAKARAVSADFHSRRGVALTVAAAGGKPLLQLADPLRNFLDDHRDPNVPLSVSDYVPVHFVFSATIHLLNGYKQSVVQAAAEAVLGPNEDGTGYLGFAQLQFGQTMFQSALITVLQDVPGVDWVELLGFYESPSAAGHGFGGTAILREAIIISPQEIAWPTLDDSATAAVDLKLSGGVNDLGGP